MTEPTFVTEPTFPEPVEFEKRPFDPDLLRDQAANAALPKDKEIG